MNKKTSPDSETIKLTVSEVQPESNASSTVDELYSKKAENNEAEDMINSPAPSAQNSQKPAKSPAKGFLMFVIGLLAGGLVTGGVFGLIIKPKTVENQPKTNEAITPAPIVEVTPEVTEEPEKADYSQLTVKVLNGSGVDGAAATVKDLIKEIVFKSVQTGNASVSNQKETIIQIKENVPAGVFEKLKLLLANYNVTLGDPLKDSAGSDIQIIVGTKK